MATIGRGIWVRATVTIALLELGGNKKGGAATTTKRDYLALDVQVFAPTDYDPAEFAPSVPLSAFRGAKTHLRAMHPKFAAISRISSVVKFALTRQATKTGCLWLNPNILTSADCEGGGEVLGAHAFYTKKHELEYKKRVDEAKALEAKAFLEATICTLKDMIDEDWKYTIFKGAGVPDWRSWPVVKAGQPDMTHHLFGGTPMYLTVSSELPLHWLRVIADVFTLQKSFRAEESLTSRHLVEFEHFEKEKKVKAIDPNLALAELLDDLEDMLRTVFSDILEHAGASLRYLEDHPEKLSEHTTKGLYAKIKRWATCPYARITVREAVAIIQKHDKAIRALYPELDKRDSEGKLLVSTPVVGDDLHSAYEKWLCTDYKDPEDAKIEEGPYRRRITGNTPLFLCRYEAKLKSFYMFQNADGTADCVDVQLPGVGEIVGGSMREFRLPVLMKSMAARGMHKDPAVLKSLSALLDVYRKSPFPHGGFGLGVARLVQICTGQASIHDVEVAPISFGKTDDYGPPVEYWQQQFEALGL